MAQKELKQEIFKTLKEYTFLGFTLSLVASYFGCSGYFSYFNVDISSYLTIQDLTMIFTKYIWLSGMFVLLTMYFFYWLIYKVKLENSWLDKTIGKTRIKRAAILVFLFWALIITLSIVSAKLLGVFSAFIGYLYFIMITVAFITWGFSAVKNKNKLSEFSFKEAITLIMILVLFVVTVPFIFGLIFADNSSKDYIKVTFENGESINTTNSDDQIYIGKTSNYFFIYSNITESTSVYPLNSFKKLEVLKGNDKID